mmetsp:Transcript_74987/g.135051  ORF Transcript_74987/g.135051 Transcript_74987/m.135051 type:complete len:201 (+) Transcript_74987:1191-1793(+)
MSQTRFDVGDVSRRRLRTSAGALRFSAQAKSSNLMRLGRSSTSAKRILKGRLTRCWLITRQYFPCSGYVCTLLTFVGSSPAMPAPIAKATGEIMYCLERHCTMSKWKETQSLMKRLVVGTSNIITSNMQRPKEPSRASPQRPKCSTREAKSSRAVMGLPYLSRCTKSTICDLANEAVTLDSGSFFFGAMYGLSWSKKDRT